MLLYGYPGSGKTLMSTSVAKHLKLNNLSIKGPELLNKYIGASEQGVRDAFEKAQSMRPCILIFDEFDAIVPKRTSGSVSVTDRVVNQFLTYLDGVEDITGVYIIAITTRPDLIDPAVIRAGRIDQHMFCDLPDENDRKDFFENRLQLINCDKDCLESEFISKLVQDTKGFSYANLAGYLRNLQVIFFEKLSKYSQQTTEQTADEASRLSKKDLAGCLPNSAAFGDSAEYDKLKKIYDEFSVKGLVSPQKPGTELMQR
jgi:peroxin-1